MDITSFLARVVAPGNYIATTWKAPTGRSGMGVRFWPYDELPRIAGHLRWHMQKGADVYFAPASFNLAIPNGLDTYNTPQFKGERRQANVNALRTFWVDIDVKREGDKKGTNVYPDRRSALAWALTFAQAMNLPPPNIWLNSGYGYHLYWVLEDAMPVAAWAPYAEAFRVALVEHGFKCEAGISSDSARILRPADTLNFKVPATPVTVRVLAPHTRADYPNALILQALQPYVGRVTPTAPRVVSGSAPAHYSSSAVGSVAALAVGAPAAILAAQAAPNMVAAAQANIAPTKRHHKFANIATKCAQVSSSLAAQGNGDNYYVWYLGHLSLAHHCIDGSSYTHEISKGDPRYTVQATDAAVARVAAEQRAKGHGPPSCAAFDRWRPGVCQGCPHFGKVLGPWNLGADDGDLPDNWRRLDGRLEQYVKVPGKDDAGYWRTILAGDVYGPTLDRLTLGGHAVSFTFEQAGSKFPVRAEDVALPGDGAALAALFGRQHITLHKWQASAMGDFIVAWINDLRNLRAERIERVHPFGYAVNGAGDHSGLAVAGTLYRPDGSTEPASGGDAKLVRGYTPHGTLAKWQAAFDVVAKGRPDLQVLIAASFGAPLMHFAAQSGLTISAWSRDSGAGKTSALRVAQAVWGEWGFVQSLSDTENFTNAKLGMTRVMPSFWDEMRVGKDAEAAVNNLFRLTQGKEKSRLNSDVTMREVREWETIMVACSNASLMDRVTELTDGTDAGAARVLEFKFETPQLTHSSQIDATIAQTKDNYGHAGRMFAQYISCNYDAVHKLVQAFQVAIEKELAPAQAVERLYIAGLACLLVGAKLANQLKLTTFDLRGLHDFLRDTVLHLRGERRDNLLVNNGQMDVQEVLGTFVAETAARRIVTNRFATQGPKGDFEIVWQHAHCDRVDIQVSQREKRMRISRSAFNTWCRHKGYGAREMRANFLRVFQGAEGKAVLGGGTGFGGGKVWCLDIPLTGPGLDHYLYAVSPTQTQTPAMKLASAPNQGKQ